MSPLTQPASLSRPRRRGGFTLIEVLLVLLIIGLLAGVAIFAMGGAQTDAQIDTTRAKLVEIENAIERYTLRFGQPPSEADGLQALLTGPTEDVDDTGRAFGPLLRGGESALQDAWGNEINYEVVEDDGRRRFYIWSNGPNGTNDNREGDDILPRPRAQEN